MSLVMTMEPEQHHQGHGFEYHDSGAQWIPVSQSGFNSQQPSPIHEHEGFGYAPMGMGQQMYSASMPPPRSAYQSLQPLLTPQWPSMLTSQSTYTPIFQASPISSMPMSAPLAAPHMGVRTASTPRKTLTDADRRRMCLYAEEHPNVKQTEIGAMFGVERSTVSKVLRNKEKYLFQEQGDRSPVRKPKGKFPDIERALANWAKNHQKQGLPMSDALIKEKLHHFSLTVGNSDAHVKIANASWLEKFKQKNQLMGAKSRKSSVADESEAAAGSSSPQAAPTPNISSASPSAGKEPSPAMDVIGLAETKQEQPDAAGDDSDFAHHHHADFAFTHAHKPYHSLSTTSLASAFNDAASSAFSPIPRSPASPFFHSTDPGSAFMAQPGSQAPSRGPSVPAQSNVHPPPRQRSQTYPMLGIEPGSYVSPPSSEPLTPKFSSQAVMDGQLGDVGGHFLNSVEDIHEHGHGLAITSSSMHPPPPPSILAPGQPGSHHPHTSPVTPSSAASSQLSSQPSLEDTRRALEVVMTFFQNQPSGYVEPQDYVTIGKLMEKLKLQHQHHPIPVSSTNGSGEMPGGMHRIPSAGFLGKE